MRTKPSLHLTHLAPRLLLAWMLGTAVATADFTDVTAPKLTGFSLIPASVDVSSGPAAVTVRIEATDELSGVDLGATGGSFYYNPVYLRSPGGLQYQYLYPWDFTLVDGDALAGAWEATLTIPQFAEAGTWEVTQVRLADQAGNTTLVGAVDLAELGFSAQLEVVSTPDTTPPELVDFQVVLPPGAMAIDTSAGDVWVPVIVQARDAVAGIGDPGPPVWSGVTVSATWRDPEDPSANAWRGTGSLPRVEGTEKEGTWEGRVFFPRYSQAGSWRLYLSLTDKAGNSLRCEADCLQAAGFQHELLVESTPSDTAKPEILGLALTPITIDTSEAPREVTVTIAVRDDLSGCDYGYVSFRSPSGQQRRWVYVYPEAGPSILEGKLTGTLTFPRYSEAGTWLVEAIQVSDRVRNLLYLLTAQLQALGIPVTFNVILPTLNVDGSIDDPEAGGSVQDEVFGENAQVTFPAGALTEPTDVAIDVLADPLQVPMPSGFVTPGTLYVNIDLDPEPTYPLPPPGLTVVVPVNPPLPPGSPLSLFRINTDTGLLEPSLGADGEPVLGMVDPDGDSATFTGIVRLSTVVGLIPETIPVTIDIKPGSDPNTIKLRMKGTVAVAVLGSPAFDATQVDPASVALAGAPVARTPRNLPLAALEDVNGDGWMDLVVHVVAEALGLGPESTAAVLTGNLFVGTPIRGVDAVRMLP